MDINFIFKKRINLIAILIILLIAGGLIYFLVFQKPAENLSPALEEKTLEEALRDLTAPVSSGVPETSEEITRSLTAPEGGGVSEEIIQSLTAPQQ